MKIEKDIDIKIFIQELESYYNDKLPPIRIDEDGVDITHCNKQEKEEVQSLLDKHNC